MPVERSGVIVTNEIPNVRMTQPLSPADLERAKRIRWQWVLAYNKARSAPPSVAAMSAAERCEEVIAIIDAILAAQPTVH